MDLLLDTHVWIWTQEDPDRLGTESKRALGTAERLFVATISSLEIARLLHLGAIELEGALEAWIQDAMEALRAVELDLTREVAVGAYRLRESFHRDPADRILAATALVHDLTLMTADERILAYDPVSTLDARR